jgi:hypothetical protein
LVKSFINFDKGRIFVNKDLIKRIEKLRKKMISVGMTKGFTAEETINLSQELDNLLNLTRILLRKTFA